jgi:thymidylate synthase (FAD)
MKIIKANYEIMTQIDRDKIIKELEIIGRVCYKSESLISENSAPYFVRKLMNLKHESVIEHTPITVKLICDRGVSHEVVRHRIASYTQSSTRYCNFSNNKFGKEITFIQPCWFESDYTQYNSDDFLWIMSDSQFPKTERYWLTALYYSELSYMSLLQNGWTAQQARSVLPNSLQTELFMTMNLREWRHFFKLRTSQAAHPDMRGLTIPMLKEFQQFLPEIFDDINLGGNDDGK